MTEEPVDTGFDAVFAGEVWKPPEEASIVVAPAADGSSSLPSGESEPTVTSAFSAAGPPEVTATVTTELTDAGKDAAKALIALPALSASDLARLARDMAMDIKERSVVIKAFNLTEPQYEYLEKYNDFYKQAYHAACLEWHAPLSTQERIKVEAAAILEDSLVDLGARMRNKAEGLPGVVEAAKLFAKVAGVGEREAGQSAPGERFTINIDLGGDQKITVASSPPAPVAAAEPVLRALSDGSEA